MFVMHDAGSQLQHCLGDSCDFQTNECLMSCFCQKMLSFWHFLKILLTVHLLLRLVCFMHLQISPLQEEFMAEIDQLNEVKNIAHLLQVHFQERVLLWHKTHSNAAGFCHHI